MRKLDQCLVHRYFFALDTSLYYLGFHVFVQSRSQSPRSSVGGIVGLWEKAQKNARNSLHSITIGSSTLGKRAIFKLLNDGALGVENDIARKNYVSSSFKDSCPGIKTLNHIESKPVKVFVMNIYGRIPACNLHCVIFRSVLYIFVLCYLYCACECIVLHCVGVMLMRL